MADHLKDTDGYDAATVEAVGKISEALETCERARGHLCSFHQLTGTADLQLGEGVEMLRHAGHGGLADRLEADRLTGGRRHLFEAGMKEDRRTHGRAGHQPGPVRD